VPRFGQHLQAPGPEFGGTQQYRGEIIEHGQRGNEKVVVVEMQRAYDLPELTLARRTWRFNPNSGEIMLEDEFAFFGASCEVEEAFMTWRAG
jgi:hypothetical protein